MNCAYLNGLDIGDATRERLVQIGAPSPLALLSMWQAVPQEFAAHLGLDPAGLEDLRHGLESMLEGEDALNWRRWQEWNAEPARALGARLDEPPKLD